MGMGSRTSIGAFAMAVMLGALAATAAQAQVRIGSTGGYGSEIEDVPLCRSPNGTLIVLGSDGDDCGDAFTGDVATGIGFGPDPDPTILYDNGDADFNHTTNFNGTTNLNGDTNITGPLSITGSISAAGVISTSGMSNTGNFTNTGNVTVTGSLGAGSITSSGGGTFTGALSSSQLTTGGITATNIGASGNVTVGGFLQGNNGASILGTTQLATVQVFQNLSVQSGATVDMNGNRIQDVGAPVAGTDAVNKNYVDALAGTAQTTADTALANAAAAQTTADTARAEAAVAQATADTGLARTASLGATTAAALGGGAAYDAATGALSAPSYSVAGESYDSVGEAFAAVDEQLALVDTRIDALNEATGRGFRHANGGIAAAMALGGTMIVPDSTVSVSFNLATYRGQQGFAGVVAVRAAPKVFVSGGVTGSTVRGSTGGRVGVAFGF